MSWASSKAGVPENAYILWEVEEWSDRRLDAAPDTDPYLLKHITGSLYAVVAEWELTELEKSVTPAGHPHGPVGRGALKR